MGKKPKKMMLFGLDSVSPELIEFFVNKGKLPNIARLMEEGVFAENALPPFPPVTPPNWTSIATGCWPSTHRITGFFIHKAGDPLKRVYSGWNTAKCAAEYLWDAAERVGKKSILMKYVGSWPPTIKNGIQVDGCGPRQCIHELAHQHLFATIGDFPLVTKITLKAAEGWTSLPQSDLNPLEATIPIRRIVGKESIRERGKPAKFFLIVLGSKEDGYNRVMICRTKDAASSIASLSVGEWSEWVKIEFPEKNKPLKGMIRFKLLALSNDAKDVRLVSSQVMPLKGYIIPEKVGKDLIEKFGPFIQAPGFPGPPPPPFWDDLIEVFLEDIEYQNTWFAKATTYLMEKYNWDLYFIEIHSTDHVEHGVLHRMDPLTAKSCKESEKYEKILCKVYESCDRFIGTVLGKADENTLKIVVSDHGHIAWTGTKPVGEILKEEGLLQYTQKKAIGIYTRNIDWRKTKAFPSPTGPYIYINLKGRDPYGVVEPGKEYERVRDLVIDALSSYKDPETGLCPFSLVLRKEDARILGLYGDLIGDVVYAHREGFHYGHGTHLPTAKYGMSSMKSLFIMAGPGVKENYRMKRTMWLIDIAPTVAYLMDIPMPRNAEGAILYEALVDLDSKLKEMNRLRTERDQWKEAYEDLQGFIHIEP